MVIEIESIELTSARALPVQCSLQNVMLSIVEGHVAFLLSVKGSVSDFDGVCDTHVREMKRKLAAAVATSLLDAAAAMDKLKENPLSPEHPADVAKTMADCMAAPNVQTKGREVLKQQQHMYFQNYMTSPEWDILTSTHIGLTTKVDTIVDRMKSIGLLSLTEKTAVAISVILVLAHTRGAGGAADSHDIMNQIKTALKKARLGRGSDVVATYADFPADVQDFMRKYPLVYGDTPPAKSPLDESLLQKLRSSTGCRKTHTTLRNEPVDFRRAPHMTAMNNMLMPLMQAAMSCFSGRRGRSDLQLDMFQGHQTPPAKRQPLALMDGSPDYQHGSPSDAAGSASADSQVFSTSLPAPLPAPMGVAAVAAEVKKALATKRAAKATKKDEDDSDVDEEVEGETENGGKKVSRRNKGKAKAMSKGKPKAKAAKAGKPKAKAAKAEPKAKADPKAKAKKIAKPGGKLLLGCCKCRGCHTGCSQCRDPAFLGKRWQRK